MTDTDIGTLELLPFFIVSKLATLTRTTIYKRMNEGTFPRPVSLGPNCVRWRSDDIAAWIDAQTASSSDAEANAAKAKKAYSARKPKANVAEQTDIGTLEQEVRQVRARLARVEGERDALLTAMEYTLNMLLSNPDTKSALFSAESILHEAIATVKGSQ